MPDRPTLDRLMPLSEVKAHVGLGHTAIYRMMAAGDFPRARAVGPRSVRWLESEVQAWIEALPRTGAL